MHIVITITCLMKILDGGRFIINPKLWLSFIAATLFLSYPSAIRPENLPKLEQLRPVLEHMQAAMKGTTKQEELQYSLIRCAGLLYGAANAEHQRVADAVVDKKKRTKLLLGPQKGLAKKLKGFGENLHRVAMMLQLKFDGSANNEKSEKKSSLHVNLRVNDFSLMYTNRMFNNLKSDGTVIKNDKLLEEDTVHCIGMHQQMFEEESAN